MKHDWFIAALTFLAAVGANGVIYAYGQGQMAHRVLTLENQIAEMRVDWKEARARLERELKERK